MSRTPALVLIVSLLLPSRGAAQDDVGLIAQVMAGDPDAAKKFLSRTDLQNSLAQSDVDNSRKVLARAAELRDIDGMLYSDEDAAGLRQGFLNRDLCEFCLDEGRMDAWIARYEPDLYSLNPNRRQDLTRAYWRWETLSADQRAWLIAAGDGADRWAASDLSYRQKRLAVWAKSQLPALLAMNPRDWTQASAMADRAAALGDVLSPDDAHPIAERMDQVWQGLKGLDKMQRMPGADKYAKDPDYRAALNAATPEERLAALSRFFDRHGQPDDAVRALAPAKPGQTFDASSRRVVAGLLESGLLSEIKGTWAGNDLANFFTDHPLRVKLDSSPGRQIAWYGDGVLGFNEQYVAQYVKARGRTLEDLGRDPALLKGLVREIAPIFVHESTHDMQDVWAKANGLPFYGGEGAEKEAMMVEALYVLQKERLDPSYAQYLVDNQDSSKFVEQELELSNNLYTHGADWFGEMVMAGHYPEFLSIAGSVWCGILWHNRVAPSIEAELARRAQLPAPQQQALQGARDFQDAAYASQSDFKKDLPNVGTKYLQTMLAEQKLAFDKAPDAYAAYVKRLSDATALTDQRTAQLKDPKYGAGGVPLPATAGGN